jgi:outer membrane protein
MISSCAFRYPREMRSGPHGSSRPRSLALAGVLLLSSAALAESPLTLAEALRQARAHNAALPVAELDTSVATAKVTAAKGRLWPTLGISGDVHDGVPSPYASGDARLQVLASFSVYDGGRLRADIRQAEAGKAASAARFRIAERDLDYQVKTSFSQGIELEEEIALGERGLERLRRYVDLIAARRRSGQPLAGDLLKAEVERNRQAADLADRRRQLAGALLELKDLLGRMLRRSPPPKPSSGARSRRSPAPGRSGFRISTWWRMREPSRSSDRRSRPL